jgi:hypothetical protein
MQLPCNTEQQEQEQEHRRRHKQQLLLQPQQQLHLRNQQQLHLRNQQQQQLLLPNVNSLNYKKHVHKAPTYEQQGPTSFYQNNNMVVANQNQSMRIQQAQEATTQNQPVMIQQVQEATTQNQPMTTQQVQGSFYNVASFCQNNNEMKILAGGPRETQFQTNHINPPMQTYDHKYFSLS